MGKGSYRDTYLDAAICGRWLVFVAWLRQLDRLAG
jgi:hypothetical protein